MDPIQFQSSALIPNYSGTAVGTPGAFGTVPGTFGAIPAASPLGLAGNLPLFYTAGNERTPYVQFYNLTLQRDMRHGILADLGYVGNVGRDLPYTQNVNAALPGTGIAGEPYAALGITSPIYLRGTATPAITIRCRPTSPSASATGWASA